MEGWYSDPYDRHEARWISQGSPSSLVRDGLIQGQDPVARRSFSVNPVKLDVAPRRMRLRSAADGSSPGAPPKGQAGRRNTMSSAPSLTTLVETHCQPSG
jgi:hypothetical protein